MNTLFSWRKRMNLPPLMTRKKKDKDRHNLREQQREEEEEEEESIDIEEEVEEESDSMTKSLHQDIKKWGSAKSRSIKFDPLQPQEEFEEKEEAAREEGGDGSSRVSANVFEGDIVDEGQARLEEGQEEEREVEGENVILAEIDNERIVLSNVDQGTRTLSPYGLMIMIYFWTCGGPFGIESAISAGGAGLTFVTLIVILIFWCLPQALMAAELSLMMNYNGGNVVWVQRAFGDFIGFVNAMCALFMNLDNQAILTVLFLRYLPNDINVYLQWGVRAIFIGLTTLINIWSVDFISKISWILLFFVFTPFFAEIGVIIAQSTPTNFSPLLYFPHFSQIKWNVLLSTIVWNFGGLDLIGFVAGEVTGGSKGFLKGVIGAFPLIFINYSFPVLLNYILDSNYENWDSGYFVVIAKSFFPNWMVIWMTAATCTGIFGTQLSSTTTTSRLIWAMAKGKEENIARHRYLPKFFSRSYYDRNNALIPIVGTLTNGILTFALSIFSLEFLIQFFLILRILNLLFEYAALIYFKFYEPHHPRPFEIPGKRIGAILCVLPTLLISGLSVATSDYLALLWSGGVIVLSILLYGVKVIWIFTTNPERRLKYRISWGMRKEEPTDMKK